MKIRFSNPEIVSNILRNETALQGHPQYQKIIIQDDKTKQQIDQLNTVREHFRDMQAKGGNKMTIKILAAAFDRKLYVSTVFQIIPYTDKTVLKLLDTEVYVSTYVKKFFIISKSEFLIKIGLALTTYSSISITGIFLYFFALSIALVLALQTTFFANILLAFTHHETIFLSLVISTDQIYIGRYYNCLPLTLHLIHMQNSGLFPLNQIHLRGHTFKLSKEKFRTKQRQNFICNRIFDQWNGLSSAIVTADTINGFKNNFDKTTQ
ncbi:hypothetical protein WA026_007634 [Henosepilachna vigintioctopunctata]|uniref:Uncharacterized protein n=1 Tax=Henosepilachna vigintioctopunctata TaxID=420089 RepID=A0AAW1TWY6_9CUCU